MLVFVRSVSCRRDMSAWTISRYIKKNAMLPLQPIICWTLRNLRKSFAMFNLHMPYWFSGPLFSICLLLSSPFDLNLCSLNVLMVFAFFFIIFPSVALLLCMRLWSFEMSSYPFSAYNLWISSVIQDLIEFLLYSGTNTNILAFLHPTSSLGSV